MSASALPGVYGLPLNRYLQVPAAAPVEVHFATAPEAGGAVQAWPLEPKQRPTGDLDDVRAMILREMQERLDSQRSIQEGFEQQRHVVAQLSSRLDEAVAELNKEWQAHLSKVHGLSKVCSIRVDGLEVAVTTEAEARSKLDTAYQSELQDLRQLVSSDLELLKANIPELREEQEREHGRKTAENGKSSREVDVAQRSSLDGAQDDYLDLEALDHNLSTRLQELRQEYATQISGLDAKLTEEWTGLRGWVDAAVVAVVNRISTLECTLQSEVAERKERMQEVRDEAASSWEQLQRLQIELEQFSLKGRLGVNAIISGGGSVLTQDIPTGEVPTASSDQCKAEHVYTPRNHVAVPMQTLSGGTIVVESDRTSELPPSGRMQQLDRRMTLSACSLQGSAPGSMTFRSQPPTSPTSVLVNRLPPYVGCPPGGPPGIHGTQTGARVAYPQSMPVVMTSLGLGGPVDGKRQLSGPPSLHGPPRPVGAQVLHVRP